uniref:Uncharacterized protein n=1 Tax=Parastrongyloides trichosuri TaxID=131310 RepID=A0A0N4ZXW7_PARTI
MQRAALDRGQTNHNAEEEAPHGLHPAPAALCPRRPGARHRQGDDELPLRQAPSDLCRQPEQGRRRRRRRRPVVRRAVRQDVDPAGRRAQQRRRRVEPHLLLGRPGPGGLHQGRADPLRQWLGLAERAERQAEDHLDAEPGQLPDGLRRGKGRAPARRRRLGARLLPEVPEPPRRVPGRLLVHRELEQGQRPVRRRQGLIA